MSSVQQQKLITEITEYKSKISGSDQQSEEFKRKIQQLLQENQGLGNQLNGVQEALRLSTAQQNKLLSEFNLHKQENNMESETYKIKIQKLMNENSKLGEEI